MKYLIELHFIPDWGRLFIYTSVFVLLVGMVLVVFENAKSGEQAKRFARLGKQWLLFFYLVYWSTYVVSLYFAESLKEHLPVYQYELTKNGCNVVHSANVNYSELENGGCSVYGYSNSTPEKQRVIYIDAVQITLDKCDITFRHLRDISEYQQEFDRAYHQSNWW